MISTGVVSLRSDDATGSRADVLKIVDVHGGQVTDEETSTDADGAVRMSRMVVRVPVADFYETVDALEKVAELESSNKSSENVSLQVIDNQVRIRAQERSLRRIEILLDRAQTVRDIVSIESELTRRQAELDSLKSQQTYLADQTSLSTITVYLEQKAAQPKPEKEEKTDEAGFLAGLEGGWSALTAFGTVIATIVGALLPWLVVARDPRAADLARVAAPRPRRPPAPAGPDPLGCDDGGRGRSHCPARRPDRRRQHLRQVRRRRARRGREVRHGRRVRRAYGDWSSERLKGWKVELNRQPSSRSSSSPTPPARTPPTSAWSSTPWTCSTPATSAASSLVSSDSDFTRLATRLQESGKPVYGIGRQATPSAFQSACTQFIYLENIEETPGDRRTPGPVTSEEPVPRTCNAS